MHEVPQRRAAHVLRQGGTQAKDRHDKGQLAETNPWNTSCSCPPQMWACISVTSWVQNTRCPGLLQTTKIKIARKDSKHQDFKSTTMMTIMFTDCQAFYLMGLGGFAFTAWRTQNIFCPVMRTQWLKQKNHGTF